MLAHADELELSFAQLQKYSQQDCLRAMLQNTHGTRRIDDKRRILYV